MSGLGTSITDGSYTPASMEQVVDDLSFRFDCPEDLCSDLPSGVENAVQATIGDISSGKNLVGKTAGNDSATDYQVWTDGSSFKGWAGAESPEDLVRTWLDDMGAIAFDLFSTGTPALDPWGNAIEEPYITSDGLDYVQLTQKFLLGAVAFSQGADDYLSDDVEGKGLWASHEISDEKAYTAREHAWDEGFGYFGAAINYIAYTDAEIKGGDSLDIDGDNMVDLKTEKNWGHCINAAKRDVGATEETDFTTDAWDAFWAGRELLHSTRGQNFQPGDAAFTELQGYRDQAISAWEKAISATVVHYINDTLGDMDKLGTDDYSFKTHAKHWGEMKGFALGLQFNPNSPLITPDASKFETLHTLFGDSPVTELAGEGEHDAYRADLLEARALLQDAYSFSTANVESW